MNESRIRFRQRRRAFYQIELGLAHVTLAAFGNAQVWKIKTGASYESERTGLSREPGPATNSAAVSSKVLKWEAAVKWFGAIVVTFLLAAPSFAQGVNDYTGPNAQPNWRPLPPNVTPPVANNTRNAFSPGARVPRLRRAYRR